MVPPPIRPNREMLSHFDQAIKTEWLITNGLGGYASSTILGVNTRKYHGLLIAALRPPRDRRVFLAKLDEDLFVGNEANRLGANEFENGFFPEGYRFLWELSISPFPAIVYKVADVDVQKKLFMPYGKNAVVALYRVVNRKDLEVKLRIFPIVNGRRFHDVTERTKSSVDFSQKQSGGELNIQFKPFDSCLMINCAEGHYVAEGKWVERMFLREDAERGESCFDDCYEPGFFEIHIEAGETKDFAVTAAAGENESSARAVTVNLPLSADKAQDLLNIEVERCENLLKGFYETRGSLSSGGLLDWLVWATDSFLVRIEKEKEKAVIAGYHWFESWGRDTFVSLPGLVLVPSRFQEAEKIFLGFKSYCRRGLMPNLLPDSTEPPVYNTVDGALWFVNAVLQYLKYTGNFEFVKEQLWDTLKSIIENHVKGTSFGIGMDADGLLSHGPQLTWMDAVSEGKPVTPRAGKAVEIQALWYNALRTVEFLARKFGEANQSDKYRMVAERSRKSFREEFWNVDRECLSDVISEQGKDNSMRPNQIFAVAMDFGMLDDVESIKVVDAVQHELLTPYGLRTLEKSDSRYVGRYIGDRRSRDKAYHNGAVWPWLTGPFVKAFIKTRNYGEKERENMQKSVLTPLFADKLFDVGLGTISEVFDGDSPHASGGCISQAWSMAEPLRAYVEDVMLIRPKFENEILKSLG